MSGVFQVASSSSNSYQIKMHVCKAERQFYKAEMQFYKTEMQLHQTVMQRMSTVLLDLVKALETHNSHTCCV